MQDMKSEIWRLSNGDTNIGKHNFETKRRCPCPLFSLFSEFLQHMIIFDVLLAAELESDIRFAPSRLNLALLEVSVFR